MTELFGMEEDQAPPESGNTAVVRGIRSHVPEGSKLHTILSELLRECQDAPAAEADEPSDSTDDS